jgi:CRISPR-associated endonuclease Cas3-HD
MNKIKKTALLSAPEECYEVHIKRALNQWKSIAARFYSPLNNAFRMNSEEQFETINNIIQFHDLGKLTYQWQRNIQQGGKKKFPHASLGAAYLFKSQPADVKHSMAFSVLIHHTDRGIVTDGLENPDVRALNSGLIASDESVRWNQDVHNLPKYLFPPDANDLSLNDLKTMARELRRWSRSGSFLKMHVRRIQASLLHHILRICDVRAASERNEFDAKTYPFVETLLFGGIIP